VIVDRNGLQGQGSTERLKHLESLDEKWQAFGWHSTRIDGHDLRRICGALDEATTRTDKPTAIIARTVKGKGVSFIEDQYAFHNAAITPAQFEQAMAELATHLG
ncbi:MAG: transketolase, partial [Chloroflexi bacterium]|nr:transketolase [Chloroflexota bacterium]